MNQESSGDTTAAFSATAFGDGEGPPQRYVLRLYVTGSTSKSMRAIANLREICETHLKNRYDLEVIDLYQQPALAEGEQILAAPTLIKQLPAPLRRMIGDMSDTERVLVGLDLRPAPQS
jgi:circadian clock protein KaiB